MMKEEDFLFDEQPLIDLLGKEAVEKLKKENPKRYEILRNCPDLMPSDVIPENPLYEGKGEEAQSIMNKTEIKELIEQLHADSYKQGEDYKGYKVFVPVYNREVTLGLPLVVLANDKEVRISTPEESIEYLNSLPDENPLYEGKGEEE